MKGWQGNDVESRHGRKIRCVNKAKKSSEITSIHCRCVNLLSTALSSRLQVHEQTLTRGLHRLSRNFVMKHRFVVGQTRYAIVCESHESYEHPTDILFVSFHDLATTETPSRMMRSRKSSRAAARSAALRHRVWRPPVRRYEMWHRRQCLRSFS